MTTVKRSGSKVPKTTRPAVRQSKAKRPATKTQAKKAAAPRAVDSFQKTKAAAPASVDPAFLPAGFDMDKAVANLKQILVAQGVSADMLQPGKVSATAMTDFDGTLGRSGDVPVFLRAKADVVDASGNTVMKAGDFFKDDQGNDLMIRGLTGADVKKESAALQAKFPNLPWANVTQDWHAFDDRALAMRIPLDDKILGSIEQGAKREPTALFVITNRTTQDVAGGMRESVLKRAGSKLAMVGVVTTGAADVQKALGIDSPTLSDGQRKAITQIVAMNMLGGANLKSHRYYDDSVSNDAPVIASIAAKFPTVDVKVFEADHALDNHSTPKLVAQSNGEGQSIDPRDGSLWTTDKVTAFGASDPQPLLPLLTPDLVRR